MARTGRTTAVLLTMLATACASTSTTTSTSQVATTQAASTTTVSPSTSATETTSTTAPSTTTTTAVAEAVWEPGGDAGGIGIDRGGDVDYEAVTAAGDEAVRSGNGVVLAAVDGNDVEDYYLQFKVPDALIFEARPTSRLLIEVEYLDEGTDTFSIQYDAVGGGPDGSGRFKDTGVVVKTNTGSFRTAVFSLCDAYFANRDNGADFRIADGADGAEVIRRVTVRLREPASAPQRIAVDSCGADPFDDMADSTAIQACIDLACDGDTVVFTSGGGDPDYRGYLIDRTLFLVRTAARSGLTFTSTDPDDHALLGATADLAGFVVRLFARSGIGDSGSIDDITFADVDVDGNRSARKCYGSDGVGNGVDDNWGSWLPECDVFDDPWCSPGGIGMDGGADDSDPDQDYEGHPARWSTGIVVRNVTLTNNECGTTLAFGGAAGTIDGVVIDTAGDHVHALGCLPTDPDEALGAWSDGMTIYGPAHRITNNVVADASDIGIVTFGGRDTVISGNTIVATPGNHGMFAGIAVHPYAYGLASGFEVVGNEIVNEADAACGGIHAGIDIGAHMWGAGCTGRSSPAATGDTGPCSSLSPPPGGSLCTGGEPCRVWGYVPPGTTFTLADNTATGAQINFLVEGLDVEGELVVSGNVSNAPRMTDWQGDAGCSWDGITDRWGTLDFVAHDPAIEGWEDRRVYCER